MDTLIMVGIAQSIQFWCQNYQFVPFSLTLTPKVSYAIRYLHFDQANWGSDRYSWKSVWNHIIKTHPKVANFHKKRTFQNRGNDCLFAFLSKSLGNRNGDKNDTYFCRLYYFQCSRCHFLEFQKKKKSRRIWVLTKVQPVRRYDLWLSMSIWTELWQCNRKRCEN